MRVLVRYFAAVREALGTPGEPVDVAAGASVGDLLRVLSQRHHALGRHLSGLRFAVGQRFAGEEALLTEGVEVALLPPVSGG